MTGIVRNLSASSPLDLHLSQPPTLKALRGDARQLPLEDDCVDLIATSPPYWQKRDYEHPDQIGQEATAAQYTHAINECLREWRRVLRPTGSVFLNVGDTFHKRSLAGIPGRVEAAAGDDGWIIRNREVCLVELSTSVTADSH
ncbi:MAG: methyltransferase domain-containing protein [Chloroflexi bacterium]|nr:methyltransferase domain-containing protein [Chloroflexota bacterium]